jgi:hypothetical protein
MTNTIMADRTNAAFATETVVDEIAEKLGIDPIEFRLRNAAKEGTRRADGPMYSRIGCVEVLQAMKRHPHYTAPLDGPYRGRAWLSGSGSTPACRRAHDQREQRWHRESVEFCRLVRLDLDAGGRDAWPLRRHPVGGRHAPRHRKAVTGGSCCSPPAMVMRRPGCDPADEGAVAGWWRLPPARSASPVERSGREIALTKVARSWTSQ